MVRNEPGSTSRASVGFAAAACGKQIDGIPSAPPAGTKDIEMPFWLAGDHLLLAGGRVNQSLPDLLLVDTGAAGVGFTGPKSILEEAGIKLAPGAETEGVGGGGAVKITPFSLAEFSLGPAREADLTGAFPETLEWGNGFRGAGLISHQFFRGVMRSLWTSS